MPEILTESFCERCGTRYTFEAAAPKGKRLGKLKTLSKGFVNFVSNDESSLDEAIAEARSEEQRELTNQQLDAFHQTFQFCMSCRQYTCANCWNEVESRCLSCSPLLGVESLNGDVPAFDPLARIGFGRPATEAPAANGNGHAHAEPAASMPQAEPSPLDALLAPSAWPASDLPAVEEPSAPPAPEPAPLAADTSEPAQAQVDLAEIATETAEPVAQVVEPAVGAGEPAEAGQDRIDDDVARAVAAAELARHAATVEAAREAAARREAEAAAEAERQRQEELEAEAERERAAELLAQAERQREAQAAAEAQRQRDEGAAAEADRQREAELAAEADRRQQAERAAEEERARQAEAERQREAALAAAAVLAAEQERERQAAEHAAEAERERQADADRAAAAAAQTSDLLSRFRPTREAPGAGSAEPPVTDQPPTMAPVPPATAAEPPAVEPAPIAARDDRVGTPTWQIVAPDGGPEATATVGGAGPGWAADLPGRTAAHEWGRHGDERNPGSDERHSRRPAFPGRRPRLAEPGDDAATPVADAGGRSGAAMADPPDRRAEHRPVGSVQSGRPRAARPGRRPVLRQLRPAPVGQRPFLPPLRDLAALTSLRRSGAANPRPSIRRRSGSPPTASGDGPTPRPRGSPG